ncbi:MAG: alpha/beta hydrolase-fold protein [Candidatus Aminicenantes bacterium]|nr:alpha/beta hydrolase-fold protein [Candidatus Aminicenantes bacterium]
MQANQFASEKEYLKAAQCYLALLKFNLNDSTTIYNLACCYGRLGEANLAVKCLVMAVRAGFRDFKLLKSDKDFDGIRITPEFMKLLSRVPLWEDSRSDVIYVRTSKLLELLVKLPQGFDPSHKYPLLIGLHGNGGNPEQILEVMNNTLKKEPVILEAPQGAYPNFSQLRGQHYSWEIQTRNRELWKIGDPLAIENLYEVIRVIKEKYPISEVYILGFSQGAAYAFLSGFKYAETVAGIISIGGLFPETDTEFSMLKEKEIENGKKFRVFIAQGNHDPLLPVGLGAKTAAKLKKYGYEVEYQEYEGGHEISPELLKKIYAWMIKK